MGVLPAGTANSFARELRLPLPGVLNENNLLVASDALIHGRVQAIDLGYTQGSGGQDGRYWLLWAGTGVDAFLVNELEPRPKWSKRIGWPSYFIQGLPVLPRFSHVHAVVEVDGYAMSDDYVLVLVSNCRRYAGGFVTLSRDAQIDDGLLEIWLFGGKGMLSMSRHALRALQGQLLEDSEAVLLRGKRVTIETTPVMPIQTDGDRAGQTPLRCEIRPSALRLLVPQSAPESLFSQAPLAVLE
jgi:diacylglycerol kinase family enzyme